MIPSGAELLVRCREREGVEYVVGVAGEETLDINNALADSQTKCAVPAHGNRR